MANEGEILTISEIGRRTSTLANEIRDLNERLLRLNCCIFGRHRSPDLPNDPPQQKSAEVVPVSEPNLIDSFEYEMTRASYYITYAREMTSQLESFIGAPVDRPKTADQMQGGSGSVPANTFRR